MREGRKGKGGRGGRGEGKMESREAHTDQIHLYSLAH